MGCNQCRKKGYQKVNYLAPDEKEISFKDYSSSNDAPVISANLSTFAKLSIIISPV